MNERKCKRCDSIDFGIWGRIGLIGLSWLFGGIGYGLGGIFYSYSVFIILIVFGIILMVPMWIINYHEEKEVKE